jgi:DNA-directed RNA polymerase specialized sigma24 family protein
VLPLVDRLRCRGAHAPWDEAAVAALAVRITAAVGPTLHAAVRDLADAGDALADLEQLVLERVLRGLPGCRATSDGAFWRWVQVIARRVRLDLRRLPAPIGGSPELPTALAARPAPEPPDLAAVFDVGAARVAGVWPAVERALACLTPRHRGLIWQRVVEGLSWRELERVYDLTPGAARQQYARTRRALRRQLADDKRGDVDVAAAWSTQMTSRPRCFRSLGQLAPAICSGG